MRFKHIKQRVEQLKDYYKEVDPDKKQEMLKEYNLLYDELMQYNIYLELEDRTLWINYDTLLMIENELKTRNTKNIFIDYVEQSNSESKSAIYIVAPLASIANKGYLERRRERLQYKLSLHKERAKLIAERRAATTASHKRAINLSILLTELDLERLGGIEHMDSDELLQFYFYPKGRD